MLYTETSIIKSSGSWLTKSHTRSMVYIYLICQYGVIGPETLIPSLRTASKEGML